MARFADCFWDENDKGVEVVTEKLKNSRQTCDEINSLYEIRAQIEEEYGEKLLKLSQMMVGQAEEGALSESVSHIPSAIETTARAHMDLAQQLRHNLQSALNGFLKDHNEKCKAQEQQIENSKQLRVMHHANVLKAKDQYFAEHTKLAGMEKYLKDQRTELDPDEVQQVAEDIEEQKKLLATADQQYKRAVDVLNDVTEKWIADWRGTCDIYQGLEESRINFIRSSLWGFANMMSSVYIVDDQCCERIRSSLESTDVQQDVQTFIGKYSTGTRVTDLMPYEDLSQPGAHPNRGSQAPPPTIALPPPPTALPDVPEETYNKPSPPSISSSRSRQSGQSGFDNTRNSAASTRDLSENIPATTTTTTTAAMRQSVPPIINPAPSKERAMYRDRQNHQGRDDHDTVSFAFEEVENMLSSVGTSLDVSNGGLRQSLVWATQQQQQQQPAGSMANNHHPAQTQRPISPPPPSTGSSQTPAVVTTPATDDPTSPQQPLSSITPSALANAVNAASSSAPIPVMHPSESSRSRLSAVGVSSPSHTAPPLSNNVPSSSSATPSDTSSPPIPRSISPGPSQQQQQQPTPASAPPVNMSPSSSDIPQRATPPSSLKNNSGIESGGGNLRFKPIPNPIYDPETKRNSQENQRSSTTGTAPVTVTNASATTTTFSAATAAVSTPIPGPVNSNKKDDDDDDESEDEFPPLTQRKPREEKWMISSMRRPQQLPVRSQNARIYDRQSTIEDGAAAAQQQQRPKLHIDTNPGAAAHQVMTTVRAQLQQANNFSSPETASTVNPGIRAAPWQQGSNDSQAVTNLYKRATTTATGLGRQNSVNGPRLPESGADIVPPMPGEDYILKHGESAGSDSYQQQQQRYQQQREDTRFNSNVARRHQSTYADMGMMQQQQQQQETRPPPATQNKEHGHFGGRVSIPFFGKKDKQHQQQQPPPMPQQPPMSKQDPTNDQQQAATQSERLSDGAPILHYARSMWAYKAKIPQEMSFNVGDVFAVVHKQPDGWWEAELLDPKRPGRALVPGNYMETIQPSN